MSHPTVIQLANSLSSLQTLVGIANKPAKLDLMLCKVLKKATDEVSLAYERRTKVFEDHGCTVKNDQWFHEDATQLAKAIAKGDEILKVECTEILPNGKIQLDDFATFTVPGGTFLTLDWLFD